MSNTRGFKNGSPQSQRSMRKTEPSVSQSSLLKSSRSMSPDGRSSPEVTGQRAHFRLQRLVGSTWRWVGRPHGFSGFTYKEASTRIQLRSFLNGTSSKRYGIPSQRISTRLVAKAFSAFMELRIKPKDIVFPWMLPDITFLSSRSTVSQRSKEILQTIHLYFAE